MSIRVPDHIQDLRAYSAGKPISELSREKRFRRIVKLASNENPLGPSPKAMAAMVQASQDMHRYPDPHAYDLISAISKIYNKPQDQIIAAGGSDALLSYIIMAFTHGEDEILSSEGTFIGLYVNANKLGRELKQVPLKNYAVDLVAILTSIGSRTKIVYLANPNNPTGTMFTAHEFGEFMSGVPTHVLVVLDEAYTLYASTHADYPNGLDYTYSNLLVVRTLSKSHGLAGCRVGFAIGSNDIIRELYKVKLPFEPSTLAQAAAIGALEDEDFLLKTQQCNQRNLSKLEGCAHMLGITTVPSAANFIMMVLPSEASAKALCEACLSDGLIVRHLAAFGIPRGVRINSGTDDETEFAIEVLQKVKCELLKNGPSS